MTRACLGIIASIALVTFVAGLGAGCGTVQTTVVEGAAPPKRRPPRSIDPANVQVDPIRFDGEAPFAYVDGESGRALSFDEVIAKARAAHVIVVGEQHDQASHHELQRRLVTTLASGGAGVVVGLEMLTWNHQPVLDKFNAGEIDADALAAEVDWKKAWGFAFDLYKPILVDGRAAGVKFVALNAPRELVRAVRKKGVDNLSADELRVLPDLDLGDESHKAWFKGIFAGGGHPMTDADVDAFYVAQVVWDETMAERATRELDGGASKVIVLAGAGHVALGRGIPQRVERRRPTATVLSVVPLAGVDAESAPRAVRGAVMHGEGDVLVIPKFEEELAL